MSFAWPFLLWLLAVPAGLLAWDLTRRTRSEGSVHPKILRAQAGFHALRLGEPEAAVRAEGRPRVRAWLAAGLALAAVALARPQWGRIEEPVFDQSREILLALDLSRSMLTQDVKPSRLDRAKLLIQSLLDRLQGERVGLVVFSGTAFLQSPLSADYEILSEFLPSLTPDYMPLGGTNYGALIDTAAEAFDGRTQADRFLIILSDGGATDPGWRAHISRLTDKGVRVIGLGVGTAAGGMIPDGSGGFLKDERGAVVMARLESDTLRELAQKTGGAYRDASEWIDLPALLQATVEAGRKGRFVEKNNIRFAERFQWFLAPALLCLLASFWWESPVRPRVRDLPLEPAQTGLKRGPWRPFSPAGGAVLALAALLGTGGTGRAAEPDEAAPLAHIVGRLANEDVRSPSDWAELSNETVAWGRRVQAAHQEVPPGPIDDGLEAVAAGSAENPRAADWPRLRSELQALLQKPPEQKPPPQQQQQQQQQQNGSGGQSNSGSGPGQDTQPQSAPSSQERPQPGQEAPNPSSGQNSQDAFGKMNTPPPPSSAGGTQQVGGANQRRETVPASADPQLAASIGKLDQIRNQDSPALLYQMIQNNEPHPPEKPGKDW